MPIDDLAPLLIAAMVLGYAVHAIQTALEGCWARRKRVALLARKANGVSPLSAGRGVKWEQSDN
jgi:hypothetical protein